MFESEGVDWSFRPADPFVIDEDSAHRLASDPNIAEQDQLTRKSGASEAGHEDR